MHCSRILKFSFIVRVREKVNYPCSVLQHFTFSFFLFFNQIKEAVNRPVYQGDSSSCCCARQRRRSMTISKTKCSKCCIYIIKKRMSIYSEIFRYTDRRELSCRVVGSLSRGIQTGCCRPLPLHLCLSFSGHRY